MISTKRVVITGLGAMSPLGPAKNLFQNIKDSKIGINTLQNFLDLEFDQNDKINQKSKYLHPEFQQERFESFNLNFLAYVNQSTNSLQQEFMNKNPIYKKHLSYSNRSSMMAIKSCQEALLDSGLLDQSRLTDKSLSEMPRTQKNLGNLEFYPPERTGVSLGTTLLGFIDVTRLEQQINDSNRYKNSISPYFIPKILNNTPSGIISMIYNLRGPSTSHSEACATGNHSIGDGYLAIKYNRADCMIVGATDSCLDPSVIGGFARARALTKANTIENASIPFDKKRSGFVIGEGAGVLVLEELEMAKKRGATIYAEIKGYSATNDAFHMTAPSENGEAAYNAMRIVMEDQKNKLLPVDYVNAHATSTPIGDDIELRAIQKLFGSENELPYISSSKGALVWLMCQLLYRFHINSSIVTHKIKYYYPKRLINSRPDSCLRLRSKRLKYSLFLFIGYLQKMLI